MSYLGNSSTQLSFTPATDYFSGDKTTVSFTLSRPVASVNQILVFIENVAQVPNVAYNISSNIITFTSAPPAGTNNIWVSYTSLITQMVAPAVGTVGPTQMQAGTAINNIGYTPANKAGDTLTGALNESATVTIASAATVAIGTATANSINISGTTTITAFDTIAAGAIRRLVFAGALTLTYNATSLILPGAATITTAAGDVAEFVSLGGGNWKCFNYTKASGQAVVSPTLATVATTGSYTDLTNKPTLATVATTGSYTDLINKPSGGVTSFVGLTGAVDPTVAGSIGSIIHGNYIVNSPVANTSTPPANAAYAVGTTIAGSSLATGVIINNSNTFSGSFPSGQSVLGVGNVITRMHVGGTENSMSFPTSGGAVGANQAIGVGSGYTVANGSMTYSTQSGSWRALSAFNVSYFPSNCSSAPYAQWQSAMWTRYA